MASTSEDNLLLARVEDAVQLCDKHSYPHFVGFVDQRQRALITAAFRRTPHIVSAFWGGYEEAERTVFGVFPSFMEVDRTLFPFVALECIYRETATLTHRDFLGTVLSVGIKREKVGDIICGKGKTVLFVGEDIAPFLCEQITKVGGEGVTLSVGLSAPLDITRTYEEIHMTVASPRLDNVVKALTGLAREKAATLITGGLVSLCHQPCESVSKTVLEGDIVSIRGYGRFRMVSLSNFTKKERIVLVAHKYL